MVTTTLVMAFRLLRNRSSLTQLAVTRGRQDKTALNTVSAEIIVQSLVAVHRSPIRMLKRGLEARGSMMRLRESSGDLQTILELAFLAIVQQQALHERATQAEAFGLHHKHGAAICKLPGTIKDQINDFRPSHTSGNEIICCGYHRCMRRALSEIAPNGRRTDNAKDTCALILTCSCS